MKVVLGLLAVGVIGIVLLIKFGFGDYDPAKQAEEFRAEVESAKTWEDVLALKAPKTWAIIDYDNEYSASARSSPRKFKEEDFRAMMQKGTDVPPGGFIFEYVFSAGEAIDVTFDASGAVLSVEDGVTSADLLDGNLLTD